MALRSDGTTAFVVSSSATARETSSWVANPSRRSGLRKVDGIFLRLNIFLGYLEPQLKAPEIRIAPCDLAKQHDENIAPVLFRRAYVGARSLHLIADPTEDVDLPSGVESHLEIVEFDRVESGSVCARIESSNPLAQTLCAGCHTHGRVEGGLRDSSCCARFVDTRCGQT